MEVTPEVVGDVVRFPNSTAVAWDKDTQELIVQVDPSGYRIAVPRQELDHSTRVWSMNQRKGTLAVRRGWWEAVGHPPLAQEYINGVSASMARHGGPHPAALPPPPDVGETRTFEDIYDESGVRVAEFARANMDKAKANYETQAAKVARSQALLALAAAEDLPAARIVLECDRIEKMLLEKNRRYGDSAFNPRRIFSQADAVEQIRVRIDDKISRLQTSAPDDTEDAVDDLIGYLILLKVAQRRATAPQPSAR